MSDLQSLQLGETFLASLYRVAAAYVADEKGLSRREWQLGELLSDGELEWQGPLEEYWELVTDHLRKASGGWLAFSQNTLKYYARTVNRCAHVPELHTYQEVMSFAFFAAAGSMVNDKDGRYVCKDIAEPLAWALARYVEGNAPTVNQMREAFTAEAHQPDPWRKVRDGFTTWANGLDQLPSNTQSILRPLVAALQAAIERLERP